MRPQPSPGVCAARVLAVLVLLLGSARASHALPPSAPQGGYTQEEYPELGLSFPRPRDYEQLPLPPDEPYRILDFSAKFGKARVAEEALDKLLEGVTRFFVVAIDWFPDPEVQAEPRTAGPEQLAEAETELPITTLDRYVARYLPDWSVGPGEEGPKKKGYQSTIHPLRTSLRGLSGQAYVFRNEERTIAFLGQCVEYQFAKQEKIWRQMATKLEIAEPEKPDLTKLERLYARSKFRRPEYRVAVRSRLVRGWDAVDLDNYIVVSHTKDEKLLRRIQRDIEAIRAEYVRLFPPTADVEAVSTVRVCRDRTEYLRYGGPPTSAGYWNPDSEELVLYDAVFQERGERPSDEDTFVILYHEAFHQYIHYSAGELAPHDWFNEGYGDYFSGAVMKGGKVTKIDVNPWRAGLLKWFKYGDHLVPWKDFLSYDHETFYDRTTSGRNYCQAWSMIYFLNDAKVLKQHPGWATILPRYFTTLQQAWKEELEGVPEEDLEARDKAEDRARARALRDAFDGQDVFEIESAWRTYLDTL